MALKRSAGVGALTLLVALAASHETYGHGNGDGLAGHHPRGADGGRDLGRRGSDDSTAVTQVARRGFGATGRKTAASGGE